MLNEFSRTELLIGHEAIEKLSGCKVAVFGIGGVGSFVVEGLARSGVGKFVLVDNDEICVTNINRQLHATSKTIGLSKVNVMAERIKDINPKIDVQISKTFYLPGFENEFAFGEFDYIVDAVDTVAAKVSLIVQAKLHNVPVISCMGTGNKLDPKRFEIADISETSVCPLAKVMRKELKNKGIKSLKVLYSKEESKLFKKDYTEEGNKRKKIPGSISFVPSVAGLIISGEVIKDLISDIDISENSIN